MCSQRKPSFYWQTIWHYFIFLFHSCIAFATKIWVLNKNNVFKNLEFNCFSFLHVNKVNKIICIQVLYVSVLSNKLADVILCFYYHYNGEICTFLGVIFLSDFLN